MAEFQTSVTTGEVRLSYVHLFQPYGRPGQEPRYSVTLLIPKTDIATKQRIDAAIAAAIEKGVATVWGGARPPQPKIPIHDGDGLRPNGEPFGPECRGHWVMTASTKQQPQVVDAQLNPILDQTRVYSGVYGRVHINFFPFSNSGNRGIGAGLGPVQILRDGEPLGNRVTAEQAFGAAPIPAAPAPQPAYGQPAAYPQAAPQPAYGQPAAYPQPPAAPAPQTMPQPQIDPITGKPLQGGVWGI